VAGKRYRGVYLRGVDSEQPNPPTRYRQFVIQGSPDLRDPDTAVVGDRLAAELGLTVGDTVSLVSPLGSKFTPLGFTPREHRFRVNGLYRSGMYEYDSHYFMVNPKAAGEFSAHPGQVSLIEVRLRHPETAWETAMRWEETLGGADGADENGRPEYDITTWIDHFGNLFALITLEKWLLFMVLSLLVLIAAFNTAGAVMTSILEQRRQIGILKAIGMPDKALATVFLFRALTLSAFGIILGECLGWVLGKLIEYQTVFQLKGDVYFIDRLHASTEPLTWLLVFVTAMAIVTVACLFPLRRIAKLDVTEILRGNS
jgi:lipoprotein-releasing system permease protein